MNKLLFASVVFFMPSIFCDLETLRNELHFRIYKELTTRLPFDEPDYWISIGRIQGYSDAIYMIDCELLGLEE